MGLMWKAVIGWGLLASLFTIGERGAFVAEVFFIAWTPAGLLLWYSASRASSRGSAHAAILQTAGVAQGAGFDHSEGGSGIAISKEAQTLTLHVDGRSKTYFYTDVRNWESVKERAGEMVGVGLHAGAAAAGVNYRAKKVAAANTGFFVTVRDVDNPVWRIEMTSPGAQARWMEILRQEINER